MVYAQEPVRAESFTVTAAGGYAALSSTLTAADKPPFGFAQNGGFAAVSARCAINRSWGVAGELLFQAHAYDAEKAAGLILEHDMLATSAQVDASGYYLLTAAAGPYYEVSILPAFKINIAALLGVSTVFTPHIVEEVKTAPHTRTEYKSGSASAFYTGAALRPTWYITSRLGIGLLCSGGYAKPEIQAGQAYSLKYVTLRTGLEVAFRL